jgi:hypothetical protein
MHAVQWHVMLIETLMVTASVEAPGLMSVAMEAGVATAKFSLVSLLLQ